jgi:Bacterial PH domain
MTMPSSFAAFIGNNAFQIEASTAEAAVREKYPLLLEATEKIELAFKGRGGMGRDKSYFTSHRILVKDGKGVGSKRKNYETIWYKHIKGFAIETAGAFDGDVELHVYASAGTAVNIDFAKGQVDVSCCLLA